MADDEVLTVTARNSKGVSDPVLIRDLDFRDAAKHTGTWIQGRPFVSADGFVSIAHRIAMLK